MNISSNEDILQFMNTVLIKYKSSALIKYKSSGMTSGMTSAYVNAFSNSLGPNWFQFLEAFDINDTDALKFKVHLSPYFRYALLCMMIILGYNIIKDTDAMFRNFNNEVSLFLSTLGELGELALPEGVVTNASENFIKLLIKMRQSLPAISSTRDRYDNQFHYLTCFLFPNSSYQIHVQHLAVSGLQPKYPDLSNQDILENTRHDVVKFLTYVGVIPLAYSATMMVSTSFASFATSFATSFVFPSVASIYNLIPFIPISNVGWWHATGIVRVAFEFIVRVFATNHIYNMLGLKSKRRQLYQLLTNHIMLLREEMKQLDPSLVIEDMLLDSERMIKDHKQRLKNIFKDVPTEKQASLILFFNIDLSLGKPEFYTPTFFQNMKSRLKYLFSSDKEPVNPTYINELLLFLKSNRRLSEQEIVQLSTIFERNPQISKEDAMTYFNGVKMDDFDEKFEEEIIEEHENFLQNISQRFIFHGALIQFLLKKNIRGDILVMNLRKFVQKLNEHHTELIRQLQRQGKLQNLSDYSYYLPNLLLNVLNDKLELWQPQFDKMYNGLEILTEVYNIHVVKKNFEDTLSIPDDTAPGPIDFTISSGLKWHRTKPVFTDIRLSNPQLLRFFNKDEFNVNFTQAEWTSFGVTERLTTSHIVDVNGVCFRPEPIFSPTRLFLNCESGEFRSFLESMGYEFSRAKSKEFDPNDAPLTGIEIEESQPLKSPKSPRSAIAKSPKSVIAKSVAKSRRRR